MTEGSKAYLTKQVEENNKSEFFQPYKDLCTLIGSVILEYNPDYKFPKSLASTIVEIAHFQNFFMHNLSSLTDFSKRNKETEIVEFLDDLVFSRLGRVERGEVIDTCTVRRPRGALSFHSILSQNALS